MAGEAGDTGRRADHTPTGRRSVHGDGKEIFLSLSIVTAGNSLSRAAFVASDLQNAASRYGFN